MTESNSKANNSHWKDGIIDFTAGSLGGIALVYVGQPFDTIKVKMQTFPHLYSNMINCFKKTLFVEGVSKGLYAGTVPALASNVTENAVLFMCYGLCQKLMMNVTNTDKVENLSTLSNATAGFLGAFFSSIAICPTELVKCKLQAMDEKNKLDLSQGKKVKRVGPASLVAQIFREEGPRGFFRGLVPTLVREMPGYFFFFGGYEGVRELLRNENQTKEEIGLLKTMTAGAIGGMIFWTITYPVDLVKSRIQVNNSNDSLFRMMYRIARTEGVLTLYSGLAPTIVRTVPSTATLFVVVEYSKKFMYTYF